MPTNVQREMLTVVRERAVLVGCLLPGFEGDPNDPLGELRSLADTAGAVVGQADIVDGAWSVGREASTSPALGALVAGASAPCLPLPQTY